MNRRLAVVDFGVGERQFVAQTEIQGQTASDFVGVLRVTVQRFAPNTAGKIAAALEKENRLAEQKAGKGIGNHGERREHKEAVGGDALQHIDMRCW